MHQTTVLPTAPVVVVVIESDHLAPQFSLGFYRLLNLYDVCRLIVTAALAGCQGHLYRIRNYPDCFKTAKLYINYFYFQKIRIEPDDCFNSIFTYLEVLHCLLVFVNVLDQLIGPRYIVLILQQVVYQGCMEPVIITNIGGVLKKVLICIMAI